MMKGILGKRTQMTFIQDVPILVPQSDRINIIKLLLNKAEQDFDHQEAKFILKLFQQVFV